MTATTLEQSAYATWTSLNAAVRDNGDVLGIPMSTLVQLTGYARARGGARGAIRAELAKSGLDHCLASLPNDSRASVVLFRIGSPAAEFMEAIDTGAGSTLIEEHLRRLNGSKDAAVAQEKDARLAAVADKLTQMKQIFGELQNVVA